MSAEVSHDRSNLATKGWQQLTPGKALVPQLSRSLLSLNRLPKPHPTKFEGYPALNTSRPCRGTSLRPLGFECSQYRRTPRLSVEMLVWFGRNGLLPYCWPLRCVVFISLVTTNQEPPLGSWLLVRGHNRSCVPTASASPQIACSLLSLNLRLAASAGLVFLFFLIIILFYSQPWRCVI